jgi:HTH-type transcriptional regulator/antitoxin HigA
MPQPFEGIRKMEIKPIKTEDDYQATLEEIERIFDSEPGTPEDDRLEVLVTLVEAYEEQHYRIPPPNPIDAIEFFMESRGLSRKDLEPFIGSRSRVSDILNRRRPLSLQMIRNLEDGLGIPAEILIQRYELVPVGEKAKEAARSLRERVFDWWSTRTKREKLPIAPEKRPVVRPISPVLSSESSDGVSTSRSVDLEKPEECYPIDDSVKAGDVAVLQGGNA